MEIMNSYIYKIEKGMASVEKKIMEGIKKTLLVSGLSLCFY